MPRKQKSDPGSKKMQSPHDGVASVFTCPDCQGTLFLLEADGLTQFRCRIGHLYSPESMREAQADNVERLLWSSVRALEEQAEYVKHLSKKTKPLDVARARTYADTSRGAEHCAKIIRKLVTRGMDAKDFGGAK